MQTVDVALLKPRRRADLAFVDLDGEAVVYDGVDRAFRYLNPLAAVVFFLCDGTQTIHELSAEIAEANDVPTEEVEALARRAIRFFRKLDLLERSGPNGSASGRAEDERGRIRMQVEPSP